MDTVQRVVLALVRRAISGEPLPESLRQGLSPAVLSQVYRVSKQHDLAHLMGDALQKEGALAPDTELASAFEQELYGAVFRHENRQFEWQRIYAAFEENSIPYIPLKGAVITALYPEPWMRTSCDIDILVHREDLDRATALLESACGYRLGEKNYYDVSLFSPGGIHLELHFSLQKSASAANNVLSRVWEVAVPVEGTAYRLALPPAFLQYHILVHMAGHFNHGGCGLRSVIDLWLLRQKTDYSEEDLRALCTEGDLTRFYERMVELSRVWFADAPENEVTQLVQTFIFDGGTYGTTQQGAGLQQTRQKSKGRWMLRRIFPPYRVLCTRYPVLCKHKYLTPLFYVVRWFHVLFGGNAGKAYRALQYTAPDQQKAAYAYMLEQLGL